jgi:hypothetical protein
LTLSDTDSTAGTDTITVNATDSQSETATQKTIGVTVNGLPSITAPTNATVVQANSTAISGISLSETGNTTTSGETFTVILSDTNGVLNATGGTQSNSDHTLTISGSLAAVNADLATLSDTDSTAAADSITVNATDSYGNSATSASVSVAVTPLAPKLTAPASATVQEGTATAVSGVSLAEADNVAGETFTVVLTDTNGVLNATGGTQSNSDHTLTITGSLSTVNTDLATLTDDDATTAADTIAVTASDSYGNTAAAASIAVSVTTSAPSVVSWTAPVSGTWSTASNWTPATVPGAANQADIAVAGAYTVTFCKSETVGSLDISDANAILSIIDWTGLTLGGQSASVNDGTILVTYGGLDLDAGTFTNSGTVTLAATSPDTAHLGLSGSVTLNGGGDILLANSENTITTSVAGTTLTNVNNTIVGIGTIGNGDLTLANEGTVEAHLGTLTINTTGHTIANTGTLGSVDGDLVVGASVSGTGQDQISLGGTMEFKGTVASGQTVTFSNIGDTLKLDTAQSFAGTLAGLTAASGTSFDAVDLANFKFADTTVTGVTGTGALGTTTNVTLTDSVDHLTVTLHLLNQYANQFAVNASDYSLTSDGAATPGTDFSVDYTPGVKNSGIGH